MTVGAPVLPKRRRDSRVADRPGRTLGGEGHEGDEPPSDGDGGRGRGGDDGSGGPGGGGFDRESRARLGLALAIFGMSTLFAAFLLAYLLLRKNAAVWPPPGAPIPPSGLWASTVVLLASSASIAAAVRAADAGAAGMRAADAGAAGMRAADADAAGMRTADADAAGMRTADADAAGMRAADADAAGMRAADAGATGMRAADAGATRALVRRLAATLALGGLFLLVQAVLWREVLAEGRFAFSDAYGTIFYSLTGLHAAHVVGGLLFVGRVLGRARREPASPRTRLAVRLCATYWHFMDAVWVVLFVVLTFLS